MLFRVLAEEESRNEMHKFIILACFILQNLVFYSIPVSAAEATTFREVADSNWFTTAEKTFLRKVIFDTKLVGILNEINE